MTAQSLESGHKRNGHSERSMWYSSLIYENRFLASKSHGISEKKLWERKHIQREWTRYLSLSADTLQRWDTIFCCYESYFNPIDLKSHIYSFLEIEHLFLLTQYWSRGNLWIWKRVLWIEKRKIFVMTGENRPIGVTLILLSK